MIDPGNLVRQARRRAGLSQRQLAARARTSGPTVAAYESGRVEPRLSTLRRLLAAAGVRLRIGTEPLPREERRSLFLHAAIADVIRADPVAALAKARKNLRTMRSADARGRAAPWLDEWQRLLDSGDVDAIVHVLVDADDPEMRQNTPFASVLTPRARWDRYRRFRELER